MVSRESESTDEELSFEWSHHRISSTYEWQIGEI